jgi:hypothetical protein
MRHDKSHGESGERPDPDMVSKHARLRASLMEEIFQTERSAQLHCAREAQRLGDSAPARALRACAQHAGAVEVELVAIARKHKLPEGGLGSMVGRVLSRARDLVIDRLIDEERSYRGTLLGLRHGLDVVRMMQHVADASGQVEIAGFCTRWLAEREPLVEEVARAMTWFALHPKVAVVHPRTARSIAKAIVQPN